MKSYFAYIRVSTAKQGEQGSSLQEQRSSIEAFAQRGGLLISEWFEETETAAKRGRRLFNKMVANLEHGRAAGVIIHKIDRSARNLKDWAHLGELMDQGVEVHFVHDNLDLTTRGGRLAADLQAVVAADYIRNLRDEVRKGFYGRLKQGFYPLPAPRGYLDRGKARVKEIDPVKGPLVRRAFELYGTGNYSLEALRLELGRSGLLSASGRPLSLASMSSTLRNSFYMGIIRIARTNETFEGNHPALVTKSQFDRVQSILSGRLYPRTQLHRFLFRRIIRCSACGRSLTGELQKGHVYYRCHDRGCRGVSVGEQQVDEVVRSGLACLQLDEKDQGDLRDVLAELIAEEDGALSVRASEIERDLGLVGVRLERLTDALLDGTIDKATYDDRRAGLLEQRAGLKEHQDGGSSTFWRCIAERFELGLRALPGYEMGNDDEKREMVQLVSSNLLVVGKEVVFPMFSPFKKVRKWVISNGGGPLRGAVRTTTRDTRKRKLRRFVQSFLRAESRNQTEGDEIRTKPPA